MAAILQLSVVAAFALLAVFVSSSSPRVFTVGGEARGWRQPAPSDETYNHWASRNRFHVGDFLYFRYAKNDSVLVVTREDYKLCSGDKPVLRLDGGEEARLRLERSGFLYFISGAPGHCDAGQRLTVRVMAPHDGSDVGGDSPTEAPALSPGSSSTKPGSGSVPRTMPRGKAGDGKGTSGAASVHASFGDYHHAVGAALGLSAAVVLLA